MFGYEKYEEISAFLHGLRVGIIYGLLIVYISIAIVTLVRLI